MGRGAIKWIERVEKTAFSKAGLEIPRIPKKRLINYWNEGEQFAALAKQIRGHTLIRDERLFMLYQFANSVTPVKGNVTEFGVYKSGSAKVLAKSFERRAGERFCSFLTHLVACLKQIC